MEPHSPADPSRAEKRRRTAKRGNGEGAIYQRKSDGLWCASVSLDNGKRKVLYGKTRLDVAKKLREAQKAADAGMDLAAGKLTLSAWCDQWLASKRQIEITTRSKYETCLALRIRPGLGHHPLAKLRAEHIEAWLRGLDAAGIGGARQQTLLKLLRSILKAADPRGYLPRGNMANYVEMPQAPKRRRDAPDPDRVSKLLASLRTEPRLEAFALLCLGGGLRRGEVLGLTWGAVDLDTGRLVVRARVNRVKKELGGLIVREGAKSEAGEHTTYVADFVTDALRRLRPRVIEWRLAAGPEWKGQDNPVSPAAHVFVTINGTILGPEDADKAFKRACERAAWARGRASTDCATTSPACSRGPGSR